MKIINKIKNKIKDKFINKNINKFINSKIGEKLEERESILKPEILIPCFNHGKFIKEAISSIPTNLPITVINDCSTDNSLEIINKLQKDFKFRFINNEINLNQTGSLNKAISGSENNLFIILNADDALNKLSINTILDLYCKLPNIRMLGAGAITFTEKESLNLNSILPENLPYTPRCKIYNTNIAKKYRKLNDINMTMSGSSFLKSAWKAAGGFYEYKNRVCSFDDRDFQMRVSALFDVAVIEEPLAFYRTNSSTGLAQQ